MSQLITIKQAAGKMAVSTRSVRRIIAEGKLRTVRKGNKTFIDEAALDEYISLCRFRALPRSDQLSRIWKATLGENPKMEAMLAEESVRSNRSLFPYSGPAVYFLYQGEDIVYVGKATNILRRVAQHFGEKEFDHFSWIACMNEELHELERRAILKFKPKLNIL